MDVSDTTTIAIVASVIIGIATVIFLLLKILGRKKDTVLIVGLMDSGKTTIFTQLVSKSVDYSSAPKTYSSMQENTIHLNIKGNIRKIIDYPGNDRLRRKLLESFVSNKNLLKIVFVLDSASFSKNSRDVAELIYDIALENTDKVPIMIVCHKQDLTMAKTEKVIQSSLEKEIGFINKSRSAALKGTDGSESRRSTLTDTGVEFKWDDLKRQSIKFAMTSSFNSDFGVEEVISFIKN